MKTAQQIRKEIVEAKYPDILSKIENEIEKNKFGYGVSVAQDGSEINVSEIELYMQDLGYLCEYRRDPASKMCFGPGFFHISW